MNRPESDSPKLPLELQYLGTDVHEIMTFVNANPAAFNPLGDTTDADKQNLLQVKCDLAWRCFRGDPCLVEFPSDSSVGSAGARVRGSMVPL